MQSNEEAIIEDLIPAIYETIDTVNYFDACKSCTNSSKIFRLEIADEETLTEMGRKMLKALLWLAPKRVRTFSLVTASSYEVSTFFDKYNRGLYVEFSKGSWEVIEKNVNEKTLSAKYVLKNREDGKKYLIAIWLKGRSIQYASINRYIRRVKADYKVFIARNFPSTVRKRLQKLKNVALIELSTGERPNIESKFGDNSWLLDKLVELYEKLREEYTLQSISSMASIRIEDAFIWRDEAGVTHRAIPKLSCCRHIRSAAAIEPPPSEAVLSLLRSGARSEIEKLFSSWVKSLTTRKDVCFLIEKSVKGEVLTDDIIACCHQCAEKLKGGYVVIKDSTCSSRLCFLKRFTKALAERLGCRFDFIEVYGFGVIYHNGLKMLICDYRPLGLTADIPEEALTYPSDLIVVLYNFPGSAIIERYSFASHIDNIGYYTLYPHHSLSMTNKPELDYGPLAFNIVSKIPKSLLIIDCYAKKHYYLPVGESEPSLNEILNALSSISLDSFLTTRHPHDALRDHLVRIGAHLGYKPVREQQICGDRIDVVWYDRSSNDMKYAIEIEFQRQSQALLADLWKLCEVESEYAVLIVRDDSTFEKALRHVISSSLIKRLKRSIIIYNIREKKYVIFKEGKLITQSLNTLSDKDPQTLN